MTRKAVATRTAAIPGVGRDRGPGRVYLPAAVAAASTSPTASTMSCCGPMPV